jgi:hypothetical protein
MLDHLRDFVSIGTNPRQAKAYSSSVPTLTCGLCYQNLKLRTHRLRGGNGFVVNLFLRDVAIVVVFRSRHFVSRVLDLYRPRKALLFHGFEQPGTVRIPYQRRAGTAHQGPAGQVFDNIVEQDQTPNQAHDGLQGFPVCLHHPVRH